MARPPLNTRDPFAGYSAVSILLHWLTAILAVVLFLTWERNWSDIHVSVALLATPVFLFHFYWRVRRGFPRVADQPALLNLLERLVTLGFMACILIVAVTSLAVPPLAGRPMAFFDLVSFILPLPANPEWAEIAEEIRDWAGQALVPLAAVHIAGALVHHFVRNDTVLLRMLRAIPGGK